MNPSTVTYTIMPDYGGAYGWVQRGVDGRDKGMGGNHADTSGWYGDHTISAELHEAFAEWQGLFESAGYADQLGSNQWDWESFHARGIELSRRLKAELGDQARIIYEKAMEDPRYRHDERREVLADGTLLILENRAQILGLAFGHIVKRVVSGGQAGVDRAVLDWAIDRGMEHGGWCPKGRKAEDGIIDGRYELREHEASNYRGRTRQNVLDSDGTLILNLGELTDGTLATMRFAEQYGKPHLVVDLGVERKEGSVESVLLWLRASPIRILNVAGPRESKRPGIYGRARAFLDLVGHPRRLPDDHSE